MLVIFKKPSQICQFFASDIFGEPKVYHYQNYNELANNQFSQCQSQCVFQNKAKKNYKFQDKMDCKCCFVGCRLSQDILLQYIAKQFYVFQLYCRFLDRVHSLICLLLIAFASKVMMNEYILQIINNLMKLIQILLLCALICQVLSARCNRAPSKYEINNEPIWKDQPLFLKRHSHGKLYEIGSESTKMKLIHVYGNMYEMGFAQGTLLKEEINSFISEVWVYIQQQMKGNLPKKIPKFLQNKAAAFTAGAALDLTYQITRPFTNRKYYEEMRGVSDASGVELKMLKRVHMIGELTKGTCSMFGAWGKATPNNKTIQLRSLDWDFDGPYLRYPLIVVYHPSEPKYGNTWMNIGFVGWVGVISGVNEHQLAVSEIGVYFSDETFGRQSRFGNPFTFVLRDVLQWDKTLNQSIHRMKTTKRTCNLILGVGDGKHQFRAFQYSHSVCNVVDDVNAIPINQTGHPALTNVVYYGMDWLCYNYHFRLHELLTKFYGNITVENTIREIVPGINSGNMQAVIYDLAEEWVYVAYGYVDEHKKQINAYLRPYLALNLKELFAEQNN